MKIGLIDVDGTLPNLALMKLSAYHKSKGHEVGFAEPDITYDHIYASAIFTRSYEKCAALLKTYGDSITIGGTGWDIESKLPLAVEQCRPDYDLYTVDRIAPHLRGIMQAETRYKKAQQIVDAGIGFTSRGCVRKCPFCFVPRKEGALRQDQEIKDILNPRSNVLILNDNNLAADPYCIEKLQEIRDRGLTVDINQGCDVRLMTDEIAHAISEVKHLRALHYAWDMMEFEKSVLEGIKILSKYMRPYRQACFILVGFNTTFEQDMYRFRRLRELKVSPYVMVYNENPDLRLQCFKRWVNGRFYSVCPFDEYAPWVAKRTSYGENLLKRESLNA